MIGKREGLTPLIFKSIQARKSTPGILKMSARAR
jgi:hypothetical protein